MAQTMERERCVTSVSAPLKPVAGSGMASQWSYVTRRTDGAGWKRGRTNFHGL